MEDYPYPVTVTGEWGSNPPKLIKNKLQIYFQSKMKSSGGDCHVDFTGAAATVHFKSEDVRESVLAKEVHKLTIANDEVQLRLALREENTGDAVHGAGVDGIKLAESGVQEDKQTGAAELSRPTAVLLENVPEQLSREVLGLIVESICNVSEQNYSLEMIRDVNAAIVTFSDPTGFENLPPDTGAELLELYFEQERQGGGRVAGTELIPEEQAAIITFQDSRVAETALQRTHQICKVALSVYPYLPTLRTAQYGPDRPEWRLPEVFTEKLHPALGNFLLQESQRATISAHMQAQFCQVELSATQAKLRPLASLLKQQGLTASRIEAWRGEALRAFCGILDQYRSFECPVSMSVWRSAEMEIREAVSKHAVLLPNLPDGVLAIAGLAKDVERIQKEVEDIVQRVASQQERERNGVSEDMDLSPGMHDILQQAGMQTSFSQKYPALNVAYRSDTRRLVLRGLPTEVLAAKTWVLERKVDMRQKPVDLGPQLLSFLSSQDSEELSQKLFTSRGVNAVYRMENEGVVLVGASEEALSKAGRLLTEALASQSMEVEDEAVLRKQEWEKLKRQLTEAHSSSGRSDVSILLGQQHCVCVAGFRQAVQMVAESLTSFIRDHSRVQEDKQTGAAELSRPTAVLLENVPEKLSREVLGLIVEIICNVSEQNYSLEMMRDVNAAIVTFSDPAAAERFLSQCSGHRLVQQYQLRWRVLEPTCSVRVENLPPDTGAELLELYFEQERQGGGRVASIELIPEEQAAIITFQDPRVAETVLQRTHHICKVALSVYPYLPTLRTARSKKQTGAAELSRPTAVLLENVPEQLSREVLGLIVESICNVSEHNYSLEMMRDVNAAIVTFSDPAAAEQFLSQCSGHRLVQQYQLRWRVLEPTCSVRVENLPPDTGAELLELYFEQERQGGGRVASIELIPEEQAAIITFQDTRVAETVLQRTHHICKVALSVYPYLPTLRTARSKKQTGAAELSRPTAVLLENVPEQLSREVLGLIVESICNVSEHNYSLEMMRDVNSAIVTFSDPAAAERFLSQCSGHRLVQQYQLRWRALEPTCSVRVENLPPDTGAELLELYFEQERQGGGRVAGIELITEEQAAIITFQDPRVAETVLQRTHQICKVALSVYPYLPTLRTARYGPDRPEWRLPEAFTEKLHPALGNFLLQESQQAAISAQMQAQFCQVELSATQAKLRPLASLLKQQGLTASRIDAWRGEALRAFRGILDQYRSFECPVSMSVWRSAEKEIREAASKHHAVLLPDLPDGVLAIAGLAKDVERIQKEVEDIVQRVASQQERERNGVSEDMDLSPGMHDILQQAGMRSSFSQKYPALNVAYRSDTRRLVLRGLHTEVLAAKTWVLERKLAMKQKPVDLGPQLLAFLSSQDSEELSQKLFTSRGVNAVYRMENEGVVLVGASEEALSKAGRLLTEALASQSMEVEDEAVLRKREWEKLKRQLTEAHSTSGQSDVSILLGQQCVCVAGFRQAVQMVAESLTSFIRDHSRTEESVPVRSLATLLFLQEHKAPDWRQLAEAEEVDVHFLRKRPQVVLSGAWLRVQGLKSFFTQLDSALFTDKLTIVKPGVRKYFQQEKLSSIIMKENKCMVVLQEEEEEEDGGSAACCHVQMENGVQVMVSKADITRFVADAVVNASNEDLQHYGGLAAALLQAAGKQLQDASNQYISAHGRLSPGDVAVTPAGNLPCRVVVHAVGPRYSKSDQARCVTQLGRAVGRSLELAEGKGCASIAMPAISSGIFGFPLQLCAETIAKAVRDHCMEHRSGKPSLTKICLVNHDDKTTMAMTQAVKMVFADMRPQTLPQQRMSPRPEQKRERTPSRGAEWNSPSKKQWSPADHSRDKPSDSRGELETKHTKEGLEIVLRKGNIEDASTDVVVNTISCDLDLSKGAVSQAILRAAGPQLQAAIRKQAGKDVAEYGDVLSTDGFRLARNVFHTVCPNWDKGVGKAQKMLVHMVRACLRDAEKQRVKSLAFPAIGTGNLGFPKPLVAKIMLSEVQTFSQERATMHLQKVVFIVHPSDTQSVECFVREFRGNAEMVNTVFSKVRETLSEGEEFVEQREEFVFKGEISPTVFELCGESSQAVAAAEDQLKRLLMKEQMKQTVLDPGIALLSPRHQDALQDLERRLTVRIHLERRDAQPCICVEGLKRDVVNAINQIRQMIQEEDQRREAVRVRGLVEWQYDDGGRFVPFDIHTNLKLENAYENKQALLTILIEGTEYHADVARKQACSRGREVALKRTDLSGKGNSP